MKQKEYVIGVLGGMGSYATVDFFRRLVDAFPAEKEWERPRIIIDNNCTMPSRVRAILYNENKTELSELLTESVKNLTHAGANKILLACNTSHYFLPYIKSTLPEFSDYILDIIEECALSIQKLGIHEVYLIASEGTIDSRIYNKTFSKFNINILEPAKSEYSLIRDFIESVKQNNITAKQISNFEEYINKIDKDIILGCTELPVLFSKCQNHINKSKKIIDPLQCAINTLIREYNECQNINN